MHLAKFSNNFYVSTTRESKAKTILLIDDEELIINISEMMLKKLGYRVLKAQSGHEGLQIFEENKSKIDLIISDLEMPRMNGNQLMHKLREIDPQIKVMLSSGALTNADEKKVMNKGFNGFIMKPYKLNTLCEKMAEIMN